MTLIKMFHPKGNMRIQTREVSKYRIRCTSVHLFMCTCGMKVSITEARAVFALLCYSLNTDYDSYRCKSNKRTHQNVCLIMLSSKYCKRWHLMHICLTFMMIHITMQISSDGTQILIEVKTMKGKGRDMYSGWSPQIIRYEQQELKSPSTLFSVSEC